MGFRYPLQKVVDLKNNEKSQAEWILSQAVSKLKSEEDQLDTLRSLKERLHEEMLDRSKQLTSISELQLTQEYIYHVEQQIYQQHQEVESAKHEVDHKQEYLVDKMRDEKIWMKAKEKAYRQYVSISLKKEQGELDEIATIRYANS